MNALQIVLDNHHNDMINSIKIKQNAEMIVDKIIDDFFVFISDLTFFIENEFDIVVWRKLLECKPSEKLQKNVDRYDALRVKFIPLFIHLSKKCDDHNLPTTSIIQSTNCIHALKYRSNMIDDYIKYSNIKRKTTCCGKMLNIKCDQHYSYYNMFEDRGKDIFENGCKKCRCTWSLYNCCMYNCYICHLRYKLWTRYFYQFNSRNYDIDIRTQCGECIYSDYTYEQREAAGLGDEEYTNTEFVKMVDRQQEDFENEIYDYHSDFDCEADYDIAYNTKRDDISVVVK
tara:strand:+ start:143 stop:1000 length:858 start_codon:yes stop_codon:yes gene_type:complete